MWWNFLDTRSKRAAALEGCGSERVKAKTASVLWILEIFFDFCLLRSQIIATLTRCLGTGAYQAVSSFNQQNRFASLSGRKANKTRHKYVKTGFEKAFDRPAVLDVLTSGLLLTRPKLADQRQMHADDQKQIVEYSREAFHSTGIIDSKRDRRSKETRRDRMGER